MANLISVHIRIPPQLWIAVEGKIDSDAASRFRKFLLQTDRDWPATLPFYFPSPGGSERFDIDAMAVERPWAIDHVGEKGDAHAGRHHAANGFDGQRTESDIGQESRSNLIFTEAMTIHRQKNSKKDERGRSCENRLRRFHCNQEQSQ